MIVFYVDGIERYHFFCRIFQALENRGKKIGVICSRASIYYLAKRNKCIGTVYLLNKEHAKSYKLTDLEVAAVSKTSFVISNKQTIESACNLYSAMFYTLRHIGVENIIERLVIWNGSCAIGLAARKLEKEYKLTFLEISNLPGKLFVDHLGVNAQSSLSNDYSFLNNTDSADFDFLTWLKDYEKSKVAPPSQVSFVNKFNFYHVIDYLYYLMPRAIVDNNMTLTKYLKTRLNKKRVITKVGKNKLFNINNVDYIFIPLQVTNDSQILVNSDYNNYDLIKYATKVALDKNVKLVIKLHPAEPDAAFRESFENLITNNKDYISGEYHNTTELIKNSLEVITINSTVGLEALLYQKTVTFLGRSFYANFNKKGLHAYISKYLFDIDYFNSSAIPSDSDFIDFLCSDTESTKQYKRIYDDI